MCQLYDLNPPHTLDKIVKKHQQKMLFKVDQEFKDQGHFKKLKHNDLGNEKHVNPLEIGMMLTDADADAGIDIILNLRNM